jgi:S-adenosylmethionine hydrolase
MSPESSPFITLLTDFGLDDPWVGSLKGVLWSIQPAAKIVDMTHAVPPHDVFAGAFTLYRCYRDYPAWTVHLCVVDPGVGGPRRPILVVTDDRYFLGPDNGLFSFVYQFDVVHRVLHVTADHYFRRPLSETFHGRDLFAPVAGWLSKGIDSSRFGDEITDYVSIPVPVDALSEAGAVQGEVCAVDRFGNLLTNVRQGTLQALRERTGERPLAVALGDREIPVVSGGYGQELPLFALVGSSGLLEIAARQRSAAELTGVTARGAKVTVRPR